VVGIAQVAVERQRRQEDRSATGSFLLPLFRFSLAKPAHARCGHNGTSERWLETETQKGRSTHEGSALLLIPDDIESHPNCGGRTSSGRKVILRYYRG
jgi:hypothetical protein